MSKDGRPYDVGYRKPPQSGKFKNGQSGNPKGRPKGSKNLATIVLKESRQAVRVNGPGGSRMVNKLEATVMQIGNKAAQGDPRASREFISLIQWSEETSSSKGAPLTSHEMDQQVVQTILRRMERAKADAANEVQTDDKEKSK